MPPMADQPVGEVLAKFGSAGVVAAPLIPTQTGLAKSILDATRSIRQALLLSGIHDFEAQPQGPENKVELVGYLVEQDATRRTIVTAYRPVTKQGDPRIWIKGLREYAAPGNLLCLVPRDGAIYVVNASQPGLVDTVLAAGGLFSATGPADAFMAKPVAILLDHLRSIAARGWIQTHVSGDTAIGMVVERELGIAPNSNEGPDYLGIEVKGRRLALTGGDSGNLQTLFGKAPTWKLGIHSGRRQLLDAHGYVADDGVFRLACTVSRKANPQGLRTSVVDQPVSEVRILNADERHICAVWPLSVLEKKIGGKHRVTAWVDADRRFAPDGREEFWLKHVEFSSRPSVHLFGPLVSDGTISIDLTLRRDVGVSVRDHGYLFRMRRSNVPALYPAPFLGHSLRT